jgi:gliding motility-associated-like protein
MYSALGAFILPSMTSISRYLKGILLLTTTATFVGAQAQTIEFPTYPACSGTGAGRVYFNSTGAGTDDSIYYFNPATPAVIRNTNVPMPAPTAAGPAKALAVSANLNGGTSSPTYYTTLPVGTSRNVQYYDKTTQTWVNTGHILNSDHIAAGGGAIYGIDPASGFIFKYVGTGSASIFTTSAGVLASNAPQDIAVDCAGNVYLINTTGTGAALKKFSSGGALIATYTLTGTFAAGGGGLAVNGANVYYDGADGKLYSGVISGTNVVFSASASNPFTIQPAYDFASCGEAGFNGNVGSVDTFASCGGATNVLLRATGPGPYDWTVLSGPGTISGSGSTVTVNAPATTVIVHKDANCAGANLIVDTNVIFVANATLNADPDRLIYSCGQPVYDSFKIHLTNTTTGLLYAFDTYQTPPPPPFAIVGSPGDTTIFYQISKTTKFVATAFTYNGCIWRDTITITIKDSTPKANFQYLVGLGCESDTVRFFNTSTGGIDSIAWDFRDSTNNNGNWIYSTATSPTHIYENQGFYPVKLTVKNGFCTDTINKLISVSHPLIAKFDVDDTTICASKLVTFTNKSTVPITPPGKPQVRYTFSFGDGSPNSSLSNPTHTYNKTGTYRVRLSLIDYLGCVDTTYATIVVDSIPYVRIVSPDSVICQGQAVHLNADYLSVGNTGFIIDLGDGSTFSNTKQVTYSFPEPGVYNVTLTATYRYCPDATVTVPFTVLPFPGVDLGDDTVLCPNGQPIALSDHTNLGRTDAKYLWNTGETTPSIYAKNIGTYWARVNIGGCVATDSIMINKDCYVNIPNSFSPNGDGTNDYFLPRQYMSRSVNTFKMMIFNRWGQQVFETVALDGRGWDGKFNEKDQPQGVYVYVIDVAFDNGVKEHYTGNLTLLR